MTAPGEYNPLEGNRYDGIIEYAQITGLLSVSVTPQQHAFIDRVNGRRFSPEVFRDRSAFAGRIAAGEAASSLIRAQVNIILNERAEIEDEEFAVAARELYRLYAEAGLGFQFGHEQAVGCVALRFIDADPDAELFSMFSLVESLGIQKEE